MINLTNDERKRLYALRDASPDEERRLLRRLIEYAEDLEATLCIIHYRSRPRG